MGFVSVTCANCQGKGLITPDNNNAPVFKMYKKEMCPECEGVGSFLVHAGQIGSYRLSIDPVRANETDEAWAVVFQRLDNDVIEVVDFM